MRTLVAFTLLLFGIWPLALFAADSDPIVTHGGEMSFTFYLSNLANAGLMLEGLQTADFKNGEVTLSVDLHNSMSVDSNEGIFQSLLGGALSTSALWQVAAAGNHLDSNSALVVPHQGSRDSLWLTNAAGERWFFLDYGHFQLQGQTLHGRYMDVRIA